MHIDISQLGYYHPILRKLLLWLEKATGLKFTITSQYRIDDPGIHGTLPLRADDLRMRHEEVGKAIAKVINTVWIYDRHRPNMLCALLHGTGADLHLHIQVHPNTRIR